MAARSSQVVVHGEENGLVVGGGVAAMVAKDLVRRIKAGWAAAWDWARSGTALLDFFGEV
jgi:hypothetical protein